MKLVNKYTDKIFLTGQSPARKIPHLAANLSDNIVIH